MMPRASVERDEMQRVERKIVATVDVNGLQQTQRHPGPEQDDMIAEEHDPDEEARAEDERFQRVRVLGLHPEGSLELVMDFVDVFINPLVVQEAVQEIVPGVLNHGTAEAPRHDPVPTWHSFPIIRNTEKLCEIISSTNQRKLNAEVVKEEPFQTLPLAFK